MSVANNLSRASKWGLGRSEPDISMYSRVADDPRRPSAIQDIFNGKALAVPVGKENLKKKSSYSKFQDEKELDSDSDAETDPLAVTHSTFSDSTKLHEDETNRLERASTSNSRLTTRFWRQKKRKAGISSNAAPTPPPEIEITQVLDDSQNVDDASEGSADDRSSFIRPTLKKDFYVSHEDLLEHTSERRRRFWEFMKSRDVSIQYDIFISYNHDVKPFAISMYKKLKHQFKYSVFIDKQLSTKNKLNSALDDAIRNSKVMICLITEKYSRSRACSSEVSLANYLRIPMIPLIIEDLPVHKQNHLSFWPPEGEMSLPLAPLLYIDFREHRDEDKYWVQFKELRKRIDAELDSY